VAETTDGTTTDGGGTLSQALAFLKEPLGMGLVAGILIAIGLGYFIL
jgi:hypothetical protein